MFIAKFEMVESGEAVQDLPHKVDKTRLYKKCEVCGGGISKLKCISSNIAEKCGLKYEVYETKLYGYLKSVFETIYCIVILFLSIGICLYLNDNYNIHWSVLVLNLLVLFIFLVLANIFLTRIFLLLFVVKFKISQERSVAIENGGMYNKILKFFKAKRDKTKA